jgi:hypothetical protein
LFDQKLDTAVDEFIRQWNVAERRIKKAEVVRAGEVVASAIFELRYAGRKTVDALQLLLHDDWRSNSLSYERALAFLHDATEDCITAQQDAIDAILSFITLWLYDTEKNLGMKAVLALFPNYASITSKIAGIQDMIVEARSDRNAMTELYNRIESNGDFDAILSLYTDMRYSWDRAQFEIRKQKRLNYITSIAGSLGIIFALVESIAWFFLH